MIQELMLSHDWTAYDSARNPVSQYTIKTSVIESTSRSLFAKPNQVTLKL